MSNNGPGKVKLLVGIPSYNNARTIGHVIKAVQAGLAKYFPGEKVMIINSDGGSTDGTIDVVRNSTVPDMRSLLIRHKGKEQYRLTTPYHGIPGKGSAFKKIFETAVELEVTACAVVDSDLRSIAPEWMELLLKPVFEESYDFVAPLYYRHKYDGTITNGIVYPLTRALYGKRLRQPIGGEFGFCGKLAELYLKEDVWDTDVARFGIDIWMTTMAIVNDMRVCQSFLGAKIHDAKDPGADLSSMLCQVTGSAFSLMEKHGDKWKKMCGSEQVPTIGFEYAVGLEPVPVNLDRMVDLFRLGVSELAEIWRTFLPEEIICSLQYLKGLPLEQFRLKDEMWVDIIYGFALAYHKRLLNRQHILKSLTPLYIGKTASFVNETAAYGSDEVEQKIEKLCGIFEDKKIILINNWN